VAGDCGALQVVEAGALEMAVGYVEARGLDDLDRDSKAGAKAQDRARVLRDVGLEQRKSWHRFGHDRVRRPSSSERFLPPSC
jgi:hypothetical protein